MPLRLKALELHGYKTFAARTVFEFAAGITAIVGPNGAGKSNIADALRWVLGEQSYGLLRGKKTEDMIFSGSEHRPRAGMASAEILFDNTTGWLPIDFSEVAVARRAYRDGHNEYVLNSQHVRLRDMNELLAASGLSERTYTIVGQGLVDASLALKADDRRRIFEEAAGVGLYRVRREEALRRLESTRRNVERVEDILGEIEPRLKTLERQARRANEYAAAQADLHAVLREWYGYHWHRSQQELQEAQENVRSQRGSAANAGSELKTSQEEFSQFRAHLNEMRSQLDVLHREVEQLREQRQSASLELAVLEERRRALMDTEAALSTEHQSADGDEQLGRQRLVEADAELHRAQEELADATSQLVAAEHAFQTCQTARQDLEKELEAAEAKAAEIAGHRAEAQARLDAVDSHLGLSDEHLQSLLQAIVSAEQELSAAAQARTKAAEDRAAAESNLRRSQTTYDESRTALAGLEQRRQTELDERAKLASNQARLSAQLEVVEQAIDAMSGYAAGARFLLDAARQSRLQTGGAFGAVLDLPAELEAAIGAALGDAVDSVLLTGDQIDRALELLESPEAGRAVLLPLDGARASVLSPTEDADLLGVASELVKAPPELQGAVDLLLGSTLVVKTRAAAQRLVPTIPVHARIVTLRGEVFRGNGLVTAGAVAPSATLSRPRQRRELTASLADIGARLAALDLKIEASSRALATAKTDVSEAAEAFEVARADVTEQQGLDEKAAMVLETQRRSLEWQRGRQQDLLQERSRADEERKVLAAEAEEYDTRVEGARSDVHRLRRQLDEFAIQEAQAQVAYWATRVAVTEQAVSNVQLRRSEQDTVVQNTAARKTEIQDRAEEIHAALLQLEAEKTLLVDREHSLFQQFEELQTKIAPIQSELQGAEAREAILAEEETSRQRNASAADRVLAQAEIDLVRRQEALDSLRGRIVDDFGLVSFEYAANVEGPVPLPFEGLVEQLPAVPTLGLEVEDQLTQRRARLRRLGLVNPEAAKEFESEFERYSFMSAQIRDLHQAEQDLRQVVSELDELTRREFSRTFAEVDKQFRSIFTRLFGGGSAHLELTDPENLVETGIEIEARLPGRREQGLSLLSGGERSLTAIALVCALLKVSPTPVCVMDEVDAMLDEANVGRFRDLLKELSQDTQFIIITHNRNTVQAADFIYGVTMGRDSTSQIISLKLDEVSEEMLGSGRG